ncbi:MAG: ABC-F family ATP-binding cassette domain-containing protein [Candidatus Nanopelagicales bacterium]
MAVPSVVALEGVTTARGTRLLLDDVSLGVAEGARVGVVGRNGGGKTTLLRTLGGSVPPDRGRVVRAGGLRVGVLAQEDDLAACASLREVVLGDRAEHEWAGDARVRGVVTAFLGGLSADAYPDGWDTRAGTMSGGERRRASLARLLVEDPDLLLLDEPTNHLDIETVAALASTLAARSGSLVVVTHDRWFLDAVCTQTWEVADGRVHRYDGGYAAYVLARAERERVAAVTDDRRRNLLRKELAWLRRGPPARTSKPRFRIDAANALIEGEPPARDRLELQRFVTARLGKRVVELEGVTLRAAPVVGAPQVLRDVTWGLGPGDRIGLLGPNGAGKTTLLRLLDGEPSTYDGTVEVGRTVRAARLTQDLAELDPDDRVLPYLERVHATVEVGRGRTLSAQQLLEGFGFTGDRLFTRLGDLSGGERRRLQLLRLLVDGPNVLLLDEPTNDLDVETLTVLEDLLDSWPGSLVLVSHDRYSLERVCDDLYALPGDGSLRHLPGGVDEYLALRAAAADGDARASAAQDRSAAESPDDDRPGPLRGGEAYEARKQLQRWERRLDRIAAEEGRLHAALAEHAADHERVLALDAELRGLLAEREQLEESWLELAARLPSP